MSGETGARLNANKHGWTHPICDDCWWRQEVCYRDDGGLTMRQPDRMRPDKEDPLHGWAQCCRCGSMTTAGIFVRQDPNPGGVPYCPDHRARHRSDESDA